MIAFTVTLLIAVFRITVEHTTHDFTSFPWSFYFYRVCELTASISQNYPAVPMLLLSWLRIIEHPAQTAFHAFITSIAGIGSFFIISAKFLLIFCTTFVTTATYTLALPFSIKACRTAVRNTGTTVTVYAAVTLGGLYQLTTGFNFPDICLQFMAGQSTIVTDNQA